jgi:beta-N-acetylhexosaminidase
VPARPSPPAGPTPAPAASPTTPACIDLSAWTTNRLAAETVIVPADETNLAAVDPEVAAGSGGVILFGSSAPPDLGAQIQRLEGVGPGHLGLLVMTDEEGGGIQRVANLVGSLPWADDMADQMTPKAITPQVAQVASRMAANGINMDLAPVVDIDGREVAPSPSDPDGMRSFSGDPGVVTEDALAYARGLEQGGVIPVLKHFPGLGGASGNTDTGPAHTLPWSTLQQNALTPFSAGIDAGAPAVLVSEATVPGLTTLPASLSPAVIQDVLVGQLNFHGLIMTDSLSAKAISAAGFSVTGAAVQALRAGADMVMFTLPVGTAGTNAQFESVVGAINGAVAGGVLSRDRLIAAATQVLRARHAGLCS